MLISHIRESIESSALIAAGDNVLVAFSGGPDSTALLHALFTMRTELDIEVSAAHLNHMLRGEEADADQLWCAQFCQKLDIPFRSERIDIIDIANRNKANLEETAREQRYAFLQKVADELDADRIAVAHTADDQAETVLLNLVRGSGATGLSGMRMISGRIVRPMLKASRRDVEDYIEEQDLTPRFDASNADERFSRVFVRARLLPIIKELNPSIVKTLLTTSQLLGDEDHLLDELADGIADTIVRQDEEGYFIDGPSFVGLHPALQRRLCRRLILRCTGSLRAVSYELVEALRKAAQNMGPGPALEGWRTVPMADGLQISRTIQFPEISYSYTARPGQRIEVKEVDKCFMLRIIESGASVDFTRMSGPGRAFLDADRIYGDIEIRNWQDGDRYRPLGAPGSQKLQDLFVNAKIPREERSSIPVFVSSGSICWVSGFRVAEDFKVSADTRHILCIEED